jgi:hypothetical protein
LRAVKNAWRGDQAGAVNHWRATDARRVHTCPHLLSALMAMQSRLLISKLFVAEVWVRQRVWARLLSTCPL